VTLSIQGTIEQIRARLPASVAIVEELPPYGYRLADAEPHPNKAHAAWGRRAHKLEP
jgi:hypothetical protein